MTNEERLKRLSTEQLARVLSRLTRYYDGLIGCTFWQSPFSGRDRCDAADSQEDFIKWLKEDAK